MAEDWLSVGTICSDVQTAFEWTEPYGIMIPWQFWLIDVEVNNLAKAQRFAFTMLHSSSRRYFCSMEALVYRNIRSFARCRRAFPMSRDARFEAPVTLLQFRLWTR